MKFYKIWGGVENLEEDDEEEPTSTFDIDIQFDFKHNQIPSRYLT